MLMTWHTQFSFARTARDLTDGMLRAQIDDCLQLFEILFKETGEVRPAEPCYYMWRYHKSAFLIMAMLNCTEWVNHRGYGGKDFWVFSNEATARREDGHFRFAIPPWFRDKDVVRSHRSVLLGLSPDNEGEGWAGTPPKTPLLWPFVTEPAVAELRVAQVDLPRLKSGELRLPIPMRERVVNI